MTAKLTLQLSNPRNPHPNMMQGITFDCLRMVDELDAVLKLTEGDAPAARTVADFELIAAHLSNVLRALTGVMGVCQPIITREMTPDAIEADFVRHLKTQIIRTGEAPSSPLNQEGPPADG